MTPARLLICVHKYIYNPEAEVVPSFSFFSLLVIHTECPALARRGKPGEAALGEKQSKRG
jgi:hypothetical protein